MGLDFSIATLTAAFVFGVFGLFIFRQGKGEGNARRILLGIVLMGYGYFVSNPWACWGIGIALTCVNYFTRWPEA